MIPKILSVDDSRTTRLLLARLFRPFLCEWFEAADGEEGLARALETRPDLIILDYNMPILDGLGMLHRMREIAELRRTPVMMLTAEAGLATLAPLARLGVRDYLTKPFRDEDLLGRASRIIPLTPRPSGTTGTPDPSPPTAPRP